MKLYLKTCSRHSLGPLAAEARICHAQESSVEKPPALSAEADAAKKARKSMERIGLRAGRSNEGFSAKEEAAGTDHSAVDFFGLKDPSDLVTLQGEVVSPDRVQKIMAILGQIIVEESAPPSFFSNDQKRWLIDGLKHLMNDFEIYHWSARRMAEALLNQMSPPEKKIFKLKNKILDSNIKNLTEAKNRPKDSIGYKDASGRTDFLTILEKEELFSSGMSMTYSVIAQAKKGLRKKKKNYVLKQYHSNPWSKTMKAFENYKLAKKAGLNVFPTFRISEDERSTLMTMGNTDELTCVASNYEADSTLEGFERKKLGEVTDFKSVAEGIFEQAINAARSNIEIDSHAYFFLVPKNPKISIRVIVGDLDNIRPRNLKDSDPTGMAERNLEEAKDALESFALNNVENPEPYSGAIEEIYNKYIHCVKRLGRDKKRAMKSSSRES